MNTSQPAPGPSTQSVKADVSLKTVAIVSEAEAIRRACEQLGLRNLDGVTARAARVKLGTQSMAFLTPDLLTRETWKVEFDEIRLDKASGSPELVNPYVGKLVVVLAPVTGNVMKVISAWPGDVPPMAPYPLVADEERQLRTSSIAYSGLPAAAPKVTLLEALSGGKVFPWSPEVKQICVYYVLQTTPQYEDRAVWVIQLRGFPPLPMLGTPKGGDGGKPPESPTSSRDHIRNVVDAQTGKWLNADSHPQPVSTELETRY